MDAENKATLKGMPLSTFSWFLAGIGLTCGHKFTMWLLGILHLA